MNRDQFDSTGASRGGLSSYVTGFILPVVLTVIAFALVMGGMFPRSAVLSGIVGAAVLQILVQLHYFQHVNTSLAARWNVLALLFTLLIMILFIGGSLWTMYHLNYRMM